MASATRRGAFKTVLAGTLALPLGEAEAAVRRAAPAFGSGIEGQRRADRGDGTYVNPIVPGDHPDPTVLRDGDDYYMTFSSFFSYPGVVIWHSRDLVNWTPIGPALSRPLGTVWAMDLVKHDGRYFIYIPCNPGDRQSIFVIHADDIRGPWSDPIDLHVDGCIDPGHAVGEDGKRYLFFNGVRRIGLADDGLSTTGELAHVYDPWRYPADWVVEMFAAEGPKIFRRDGWFYLMAAVGGTSGPPTSHMVIVARSRSIHGPWRDCPHNPIVHTKSADEPWWSRGHATAVEGPAGDWWLVYHGYENGFRTLGRQTLLEPMAWTADGWPRATGGTLSDGAVGRLPHRPLRHAVDILQPRARRDGTRAARRRRPGDRGQGHDAGRLVAVDDAGGRPPLRGRDHAGARARCGGRPHALLQRAHVLRAGLHARADAHVPLRRGAEMDAPAAASTPDPG